MHKEEIKLEIVAKFVEVENKLLSEIGAKKHQNTIRIIFDELLRRNLNAQIAD